MSKQGTGQNVEDMLSSVRRLVSDELPRMPRAEVPKGPAALVLTEAQRIEPPMVGHNSRRKTLEDRISELEAAVADSSDEYEPDGSEDLEQHRPDRIVFRPTRPNNRPIARPLNLSEYATPKPVEAAEETPEPVALVEENPTMASDVETEEELHDQVETALTEAVTTALVDMAEDALQGDQAFEQALADAVGVDSEPQAAKAPEAPSEETTGPDDAASTAIDPADMRPLISSLIREELQGELGERITRNVRKLVRQEIQRALTVREVE